VIDDFAKDYLHSDLREIREAMLRKLEGLSGVAVVLGKNGRICLNCGDRAPGGVRSWSGTAMAVSVAPRMDESLRQWR